MHSAICLLFSLCAYVLKNRNDAWKLERYCFIRKKKPYYWNIKTSLCERKYCLYVLKIAIEAK